MQEKYNLSEIFKALQKKYFMFLKNFFVCNVDDGLSVGDIPIYIVLLETLFWFCHLKKNTLIKMSEIYLIFR